MLGLYRTKYQPIIINNRLVDKVEVIQWNGYNIVFSTDYPVEIITMAQDKFFRKFEKWK